MTTTTQKPEIGQSVVANGIRTNYLEAGSGSGTVVLIHGSGPGVTAYSNWRLVLPALGEDFHVLAPDMVGFGYSDRPDDVEYNVQTWADQTVGFMDAMGIKRRTWSATASAAPSRCGSPPSTPSGSTSWC